MADIFSVEKRGVAVFATPTGTVDDPKFDVNCVTNFKEPVQALDEVVTSDGWTNLSLATNVTNGSTLYNFTIGNRQGISYRVEEGHHVKVTGNVSVSSPTGKSLSVALPEAYRPSNKIYSIAFCNEQRYGVVYADTDGIIKCYGVNTGIASTSLYTGTPSFITFQLDWWI